LVWPAALAGAGETARGSALGARVGLRAHLLLVQNGWLGRRAGVIAGSRLLERIEQERLRHLRIDMVREASDRDGQCRGRIHRCSNVRSELWIPPFCYNPAINKRPGS